MSGAEIIELAVMRGLQARGHEVLCMTNSWNNGEFHRRLQEAQIDYKAIPVGAISKSLQLKYLWWTFNALLHLPKAYLNFWNTLRQYDPDVLLFAGSRSLSILLPLVDLQKTLLHVHEVPGKSYHFQRVERASGQRGSCTYMAVSRFIGTCLQRRGIPEPSIHVVPNGVTLPDASTHDRDSEIIVITIAGQVGAWKGHEDLMAALALLQEEIPEGWRCDIVGTGEQNFIRYLQQVIAQQGLQERVVWRGFQRDMDAVYQATDILVAPSRHEEPFGLVAAEAGTYRIPVIATRRGGLPEIIDHERTGFLVDAEAPEQIAERLKRLIVAPVLRIQMGLAARERVFSKFTRSEMVGGVEDVLLGVRSSR